MRPRLALWVATVAAGLCFSPAARSQWIDLGGGLPGDAGVPVLTGVGSLVATASTLLEVSDGTPGDPGALVVGFTKLSAPFKGGVLVPFPNVVVPMALSGMGKWLLPFTWPKGIPAGFAMYWQVWLQDPGGPAGYAATNALQTLAS